MITLAEAEERKLVKNQYYKGGTSFPEQFICRSLTQIFPETKSRVIDPMIDMEYDISVPELMLYIEYNGLEFHNNPKSIERDKLKELHCKEQGIPFIQIIEDSETKELFKEFNNKNIKYRVPAGYSLKYLIQILIVIVIDILNVFKIQAVEIDWLRSTYEALLLSTKYQYKINTNQFGEIVSRDYLGQVYCDFEVMNNTELQEDNVTVAIKPIQNRSETISKTELDKVNAIMFNGNTMFEYGLADALDNERKRQELETKRIHQCKREESLDKREGKLLLKEKELKEREKELDKREEISNMREKLLEDRNNELIEKESNLLKEEFNLVAEAHYKLDERKDALSQEEEELQKEKEEYQSKLDKAFEKRVRKYEGKLKTEYTYRHDLLDNYCDERIKEAVKRETEDIRNRAASQIKSLENKLSEQKQYYVRQLISAKLSK